MTEQSKDGRPAFPCAAEWGVGEAPPLVQEGMTLRDWFAGQVIAGMMAAEGQAQPKLDAEFAYGVADAMLEARNA